MSKLPTIFILHVNRDNFKTYKSKWGAVRAAKTFKKTYDNPNFWLNQYKAKVVDGTATTYQKKLVEKYDGYPQVMEYPLRKGEEIKIG
jgi:hypothetical protein